ncbi:TetR family transcriptional regulator [Kribbella antiqua]|uniref:TetR family transcriptional regulator n=1 Tax=Kribbella antiqua TaxID=2512217 RepID=A0A4R2IKC0_9ACTN|nr:TetR/AcrR family transcriptional regulator [Kribbella antiqua]TCO45433.1 TetR family transcriptional regulator [Kribbella antiqua]
MPSQGRRERAREERRRLIVQTARELAEAEGWEAVTTRRLAEKVDYSQPVLYSHFPNMTAITTAVALEGVEELTVALGEAEGLREVAAAYLRFAEEHPALYEAMFVRRTDLSFGSDETPAALIAAFGEIRQAVEPFARDGVDVETLTEVFWSALHGQATLNHTARLRPDHLQARADILVTLLTT